MRSVLIGTAGHVDHGKTALIRALTGVDCDRLDEEKRRGITLDLGFAHLPPAAGASTAGASPLELSFVDVPGHERFLHTALAGLGGVQLLLLVVAADEGIQPQTREHLEIAELLELPGLVVALNKIDAVDTETVELAELELAELLAGTRFAGAPILRVSALTGDGVATLRSVLEQAAAVLTPPDRSQDPARLPVDRAFLVKGQGVVVTGTLVSGTAAAGDAFELLPARLAVRARAVQVHGRPQNATTGERAALQLAGVELPALARGMEIAAPGAFRATRRLLVRWKMLASSPVALAGPLEPMAVRVHLYSSETVGTARPLADEGIAPGESGVVEIALAAPVVAVRGDRIIIRRPSPAATIAGGTVLDPWWRRKRRGDPAARRAGLAGDDRSALLAWAAESAERGLTVGAASARTGRSYPHVEALLASLEADGALVRLRPLVPGASSVPSARAAPVRFLLPETLEAVRRRARTELARFFTEHPLELGLSKAAAARLLLPPAARALAEPYFDRLAAAGDIDLAAGDVRFPGRAIEPPAELSPLARAIVERYVAAGLAPPSPGEVARDLDAKPQIVEGLVQHLVKRKELVRLPSGLIFASAALARLVEDLRATGWSRFSIVAFKDRFGLSRKWTIPLLEHLDNVGVTRRSGDERELRPATTPSNAVKSGSAR
ncbi:MAG: selenocysteine-specific translation elongation factor [Thermoanaerobaculia bacterium]